VIFIKETCLNKKKGEEKKKNKGKNFFFFREQTIEFNELTILGQ
jgi:hypothetical protein